LERAAQRDVDAQEIAVSGGRYIDDCTVHDVPLKNRALSATSTAAQNEDDVQDTEVIWIPLSTGTAGDHDDPSK
jgi:hypothetical protein